MPTFYSPTGNPEIWEKKQDGYLTEEEWDSLRPPAVMPDRRTEILAELDVIDRSIVRPLHSIAAGTATAEDEIIVAALEDRKIALRFELAATEQDIRVRSPDGGSAKQ